ncbi:hypothetical protein QJQ45_001593 [Haematococcus lacustris]|nr:hypothetical protein QJQ45_001593 [Haematococcus lacustris]
MNTCMQNVSLFSSELVLDEVPSGPKRSGAGLYTSAPACCSPAMQRCASGPQARLDLDTATTSTAPPWPSSAAASDHGSDSRDERPGVHKDSTARQQPSTAWASLPGTPLAGQARCQVDRQVSIAADAMTTALAPQLSTPGRPRAAHLGQQAGFLALHTLPAFPIGTPLVSTSGGGKAGAGKEASVQQLVVRAKQNGSTSDVLQSHSPHTNTKPAFGPAAGGRGGKADTVACSRKPSVVAGGEEEEEFSSEGGREEGEDDGSDSQGAGVHNNRVGGGAGKRLRFEDLQAQFGLGLKDAANNLGICATTLKRACRRHNIKRWPRRQIAKLNRALASKGHQGGPPSTLVASAVTAQLKAVERAPVQLKGQDKGQAGNFWPWTTGVTNSGGGGTSSAPGSEDSQRLLLSSVPQVAPPLQPRGPQGSLTQLGSQADASAATQQAQVQALQTLHAQLLLMRQQQLAQASGGSVLQPGMPGLSPSPHVSGGTPMMHSDSLSQSSKQSGCSTQQPATQPSLTAVIDRSCMQSSSAAPPTSVHSMPHQQHLDHHLHKQQQQFQHLQHQHLQHLQQQQQQQPHQQQQPPQQQLPSPNQSLQLTHTAQPRSPNPLPLSPPFLSNGGMQASLFMLNDLANASAVAARGPALIQELCAQPHQPAHLQAQLGPTTPATSSLLGLGHHSSMQISSSSLLSLMNKHSVGSLMHPEELNALLQPLSGVSDLLAGMGMVPEGSSVNPTPTLHMDCSQQQQQQQQAGMQGGGEPGTRHTGQQGQGQGQGQGQANCAMFMPGSMSMPGQGLGGLGQGQGQHSQSHTLAALHELFKNTPGSRETVMELLSEDLFLAQGHAGSC